MVITSLCGIIIKKEMAVWIFIDCKELVEMHLHWARSRLSSMIGRTTCHPRTESMRSESDRVESLIRHEEDY